MLNSNIDCSVYSRRDYAQDEIILKLVLLVALRTSFPYLDSRVEVIDQDDPSWTSLEFDFF